MHKILIVDDEKDITDMIQDTLQDDGYFVYAANHPKEALKLLKEKPDLIILDIMMPDMDGFEFCQLIRQDVTCPILFLSAKQMEEDRINGALF